MNMKKSGAVNTALRIVGLSSVLGLVAACAEEPAAQTNSPAPATTAPATANAATESAAASKVNIAQCSTPADGRVYFRIGKATLAPTGQMIVDAIPSNMKPPLKKDEVRAELQRQASRGSGCPEKPLDAVLLMLNQDMEHPLLNGEVGIVRSPDGQITKQFADLTRQLQKSPTKNCKKLSGDLLGCLGTETRGGRETPVMYVITTDRTKNLNTGGPLAARCVLEGDKIRGCNIVDSLKGDVTFDVTLNPGDYSSVDLSSAHRTAVSKLESLRR